MAKISVIFATIALCFLTTRAQRYGRAAVDDESFEDQQRNHQARKLAEEYIWKQLDPREGKWPHKEAAIAIMGVAADRARVDGGLYNYDTFLNETEIIYNNLDRVHLDFFIEMKRVDFDLEKIEDTVLANTVAVLRFTCSKDPLDYFGYDLIGEMNRRLVEVAEEVLPDNTVDKEPKLSFPIMAMMVCNEGDSSMFKNNKQDFIVLLSSSKATFGKEEPMAVERAAMNLLAIACYQDNYSVLETSSVNTFLDAMETRNMEYLISMQGDDGGFKTVYGTTLAIQAYLSAKHDHPQFELAAARRWLVDAQSQSGAFGSMSVTSLAIGGLVDQSVNLAKDINCQNVLEHQEENFAVEFETRDRAFSHQSFVDRLPATIGDSLLDVLENYAKRYPKAFTFTLKTTPFGKKIESMNGVASNQKAGLSWKTFRTLNDELGEQIEDLSGEMVLPSISYVLMYG